MYPEDVDPQSGCRLPLPRREDLDGLGQRIYDSLVDPKGGSIRGLRGPGGILLHSPELSRYTRPLNRYLRHEAGLGGRVRELAILTLPVSSIANSNGRRTSRKQSPRVFPARSSTPSSIARIRAASTRPTRSSSSSAVRSLARKRWHRRPLPDLPSSSAAVLWSILSL